MILIIARRGRFEHHFPLLRPRRANSCKNLRFVAELNIRRAALADTSPFIFKRLQKRACLAGSERDLQAGRVSRQIEILKGRSN